MYAIFNKLKLDEVGKPEPKKLRYQNKANSFNFSFNCPSYNHIQKFKKIAKVIKFEKVTGKTVTVEKNIR